MTIRVLDASGNEKTWDWVLREFGPLDVREADPILVDGQLQKVALVQVQEQYGPANCNVHLFDINGRPVQGIMAAWWYSTAPDLPNIPPPTTVWEPRADYGPTNSEGVIGFALSEDGYYYWPDQNHIGPYGTWILAPGHPSDGLFGLGMIAGTDHRHLNVWFQVVAVEDDNGEEPDGDELARIAAALEFMAAHWPFKDTP